MVKIDEMFMREALRQAKIAFDADEVPIGAVIVHENKVIARAHNQVETLKDPTAHSEMIAITQATSFLGSKWLQECSLYVTIEPCSMCAGAMVLARLGRLVYGAEEPKTGACGSIHNIVQHGKLNHTVDVQGGVLAPECGVMLTEFFRKKRRGGKLFLNEN